MAVVKFQTAFTLAIEVLSRNIVNYIAFKDEIKKAPIPDFPYLVYYSRDEEAETVFIHAVLHTKRDAGFISTRLGK